jgi:hypothetical protein
MRSAQAVSRCGLLQTRLGSKLEYEEPNYDHSRDRAGLDHQPARWAAQQRSAGLVHRVRCERRVGLAGNCRRRGAG